MSTTNNTAAADITLIPLCRLVASDGNVRKANTNVDSLAASILTVGLLQNLVVVPMEGVEDYYDVAAGGRRRRALVQLANAGKIPNDYLVPCIVKARDDESLVSLTENVEREDMNAAEESEAFVKLLEEGRSVDFIADAFGTSPLIVERRLALAKASPVLFELLREGNMTSEQLRALCAVSSHARQEEIWNNTYDKSPRTLSRIARSEAIDASTDGRIKFIGGVDAYTAAGGVVRRDLFSKNGDGGFIDEDNGLLDKLIGEKLEEHAAPFRAAGWKWVEVQVSDDHDNYRLGQLRAEVMLTADDKAKIEALDVEKHALEDERDALADDDSEAANERYEAVEERLQAIYEEQDEIKDAARAFTDEQKATAGVVVTIDRDGVLSILRGRVRAEDRKDAESAGADISGGRESKSAGRKGGMSDALKRSLLAHRNIAVASEVAKHAQVAKVLMAVRAVELIRRKGRDGAPTDLSINDNSWGIRRESQRMGKDVTERAEAFRAMGEAIVAGLPQKSEAVWDVLMGWPVEQLDLLNAYAVAMSVSVADDHKGVTGKLLAALNFDMAEHFDATVDNYLGRALPKEDIVKALNEAGKATDKAALGAMKTRDLAKEAQTRLAGTGWVPNLIRTPSAKPVQPVAKKPVTAKKAPAKGKAAPKGKAKAKPAKKAAKVA